MKALLALMVLVAAAAPAWAASDTDTAMAALSTNRCQPTIGTVMRVYTDPRRAGTAIDLSQLSAPPEARRWIQDGIVTVFVPAGNMKGFSALDSYVGQRVAIWTAFNITRGNPFITMPRQLQTLSDALADPKKTWCFLPALERKYD